MAVRPETAAAPAPEQIIARENEHQPCRQSRTHAKPARSRMLVIGRLDSPAFVETDPFVFDHYPEDDDAWDEDDEWGEDEMNCGRMVDGTCGHAGSEYCDWSCPFGGLRR